MKAKILTLAAMLLSTHASAECYQLFKNNEKVWEGTEPPIEMDFHPDKGPGQGMRELQREGKRLVFFPGNCHPKVIYKKSSFFSSLAQKNSTNAVTEGSESGGGSQGKGSAAKK